MNFDLLPCLSVSPWEWWTRFRDAPESVQTTTLLIALLLMVAPWLGMVWRYFQVRSLKQRIKDNQNNAQLEQQGRLANKDREIAELKEQLNAEREAHEESVANLQSDLAEREQTILTQEERFSRLEELDSSVWMQPPLSLPPPFINAKQRNTKFVCFLNLKGGVGKTTLSTNLAAGLATGITGKNYRVLAVDLDFQGSLSNSAVSREFLTDRRSNKHTAATLLDPLIRETSPEECLRRCWVSMQETNTCGKVIIADDHLAEADFYQQARFAVKDEEVRFQYRELFHSGIVLEAFDYVFFDCPPRITTSSINALLCSDYVIIPTSLGPHDVDAIVRTLKLFQDLRDRLEHEFPAELLGIVASRTFRKGELENSTKDEQRQVDRLRHTIRAYGLSDTLLIDSMIPNNSQIAHAPHESVPYGATKNGREIYKDVAREFEQRVSSLHSPASEIPT